MFKLKYRMHKLVNNIFYFLVFALGFVLGGGNLEKIKEIFDNLFVYQFIYT